MKRVLIAVVALVTTVGVFASPVGAKQKPEIDKDYFVVEEDLPFDALAGAAGYWGVLDGAGYRIEVPGEWNGDLVLWAHGYAGTGEELRVQNPPGGLRAYLIDQGYAWAASSYSKNDYHISTPAAETRDLAKQFHAITGEARPGQQFLLGVSMGGNITAYSAERYPNFYDGVLPACGVLADLDLFDYFLDVNLAFQELGGNGAYPVTDPFQWLGVDVPENKAALEAAPATWPFALNEDGQALKDLVEQQSGGDRPNFEQAWVFWNIDLPGDPDNSNFLWSLVIDTGTVPLPGQFSANGDEVYQFDGDPAISDAEADFNTAVQRVERDRLNPANRHELPFNKGKFVDPMLTMHNLGDLFVPFFNEIEYAERVQANGNPDLLVQRAIRGAIHCDFTTAEWVTAFTDLVDWVEDGIRPDGDPVLDPAAVADPDYGCRFTDGAHPFAEACGAG